jgi:ATP-dependent Zn protease
MKKPATLHLGTVLFGGRAAELLVFGEPTTGAADDDEA